MTVFFRLVGRARVATSLLPCLEALQPAAAAAAAVAAVAAVVAVVKAVALPADALLRRWRWRSVQRSFIWALSFRMFTYKVGSSVARVITHLTVFAQACVPNIDVSCCMCSGADRHVPVPQQCILPMVTPIPIQQCTQTQRQSSHCTHRQLLLLSKCAQQVCSASLPSSCPAAASQLPPTFSFTHSCLRDPSATSDSVSANRVRCSSPTNCDSCECVRLQKIS